MVKPTGRPEGRNGSLFGPERVTTTGRHRPSAMEANVAGEAGGAALGRQGSGTGRLGGGGAPAPTLPLPSHTLRTRGCDSCRRPQSRRREGGNRTPPPPARDPSTARTLSPIMWLATWIWISLSFSKVIWHLMHWYVFFCREQVGKGTGQRGRRADGWRSRRSGLRAPQMALAPPRPLRAIPFPPAAEPRSPGWGKRGLAAPWRGCSPRSGCTEPRKGG